ncbi:MAG: PBSX family phage terminase large subunit [Betaproteobacteria bacterium]|nr:PBSX family phage terminase large subunit [Betaproteobacteria bacterium]
MAAWPRLVSQCSGRSLASRMTAQLNPALQEFWQTPARNRILYGGRSSSKSWDAAGFAVALAANFKVRFLCVRQLQNRIEDSVYTLLKDQIERFGLRHQFRILENKIIHRRTGSEFTFYGLWRHISEIKSFEGADVLWIEEAHDLVQSQWTILEPTIRKQGSQVWIIFNPNLVTDFVYQRFVLNPPPNTVKRLINYTENPFLSQTMLDVIAAAKDEDEDEFAHIYLGVPRDDDDTSVIKRSWIMAAIGAHEKLGIEPLGMKRMGFDVADSGVDLCATISAHGPLAVSSDMWKAKEDELLKSATRVWQAARTSDSMVIYDSIGVGAGVGAKLNELNAGVPKNEGAPVRHAKFNAGGAVIKPEAVYTGKIKNKDMFANLKAQAWWSVGDRFRNTYNAVHRGMMFKPDEMIFIDPNLPNLEKLITELATPKRDFDNAGKVKVESKKDLAKREIASPNLADAFVMTFAPGMATLSISANMLQGI